MPVVGDFQIVTTGGNIRVSGGGFTETFSSGGRYGKGLLSYLLVDWVSYQVQPGSNLGTVKFYVNGHLIATIPAQNGHAVDTLRFNESYLSPSKVNTFKALANNAQGWFNNVICHYHQAI
jgi:hypothetical protein